MAMEYFCFFHSYGKKTERLSDQELGRLVRALNHYSETGERTELTGRESLAFDFMADDIDRAKEAYNRKCEANRRNIEQRYSEAPEDPDDDPADADTSEDVPSNTIVYDRIPSYTNATKEKQKPKQKQKENKSKNTGDIPPVTPRLPGRYTAEFERFWQAYPKKVGKGAAFTAFRRIRDVPEAVMLCALDEAKRTRQWQRDGGRYIPNPATWLNQRRWEDEPPPEARGSGNPFADMVLEGVFDNDTK